jgi:hypothetical protein
MSNVLQPSSFCDCITRHTYFRVVLVFVLSLMITFVDDIDVLYNKTVLLLFIGMFVISLFIQNDIGTLVLLTIIIIMVYNNTLKLDQQTNDLIA